MLTVRRSMDRGHANHGWLDSRHTFSFGDYYDSRFVGFRDLLVINEDRVQPRGGFPTHAHRDMEILSFVLSGAIAHEDSTGTGAILRPGELQRMSAGVGVRHSEFNPSDTDLLHFLQIWIRPRTPGLPASYEQTQFTAEERRNRLRLIGSEDARDGSVTIHQDVRLYTSLLDEGARVELGLKPGRGAWLQVTRGQIEVAGVTLDAGDAVAAEDEPFLAIVARSDAELLLFDLALPSPRSRVDGSRRPRRVNQEEEDCHDAFDCLRPRETARRDLHRRLREGVRAMTLHVVGLGGSLVPHSTSLSALREACDGARAAGASVELLDVRDLELPFYSPEVSPVPPSAQRLADAVRRAQALLWSSPLYHGTLSGSFKNALDWLELLSNARPAYLTGKVVGLIGVAGGTHGLQVVNSMEFVVRSLRGFTVPLVIPINHASRVFDADGTLRDETVARQLRALGREVVEAAARWDQGSHDPTARSGSR